MEITIRRVTQEDKAEWLSHAQGDLARLDR